MTDMISGIKPRFNFVDTRGRSVAGMPGVAGAIREISAHWGIPASAIQTHSQLHQAFDAMRPADVTAEQRVEDLTRLADIFANLFAGGGNGGTSTEDIAANACKPFAMGNLRARDVLCLHWATSANCDRPESTCRGRWSPEEIDQNQTYIEGGRRSKWSLMGVRKPQWNRPVAQPSVSHSIESPNPTWRVPPWTIGPSLLGSSGQTCQALAAS